ncbi:chitinase-3-like protein 2 [Carex littledalei]|uniref:Chitinase-3-like protein 2 n=1 Tax=Carex littledalei TaxID=544730 RepID=A0A833VGR5_9POAL|nr:chitinase-3-like protein 2 [Carex littledalei]
MAQALSSILLFLLLFSMATLALSAPQQNQCNPTNQPIRAGFYLSNSNHYAPISSINPSLYTHLFYTSISSDNSSLFTFSQTLKSKNPTLKTLLSLTPDMSAFAEENSFLDSALQNVLTNGFDGLDLMLQFPISRYEITNFALLVRRFRVRLNEEPTTLLLTATVYFSNHIFDGPSGNLDYPTSIMSNDLDWINVASFGFYNSTNVTVFDAPLYDKSSHFSASYGIISWIDAGVPPCKLVMGIPLYGRSYVLKNKSKNALGAPVVADGPKQRASNRTGMMAFFEIEELILDNKDAVSVYDNSTVATYFYLGDLWVSFDGENVIREKIEFASRYRLQGFFLWTLNYDDSNYTISTLASEAWNDSFSSSYSENSDGMKQAAAASPFELPPLENAQESNTASGMSRSIQRSVMIFGYILISSRMMFILF